MATGQLIIDLDALAANWRALDGKSASDVQTAAVVKADGYGLDAGRVARTLAAAGARRFFVAVAEEGAAVREALGPGPEISVFGGHMPGDAELIQGLNLVPMLNSVEQLTRHFEALPDHPFGIQLDSGMNRLGMEPAEWGAVRDIALAAGPRLIMSHLACSDEPAHEMNPRQLQTFVEMSAGLDVPLSLAATGGILLGPEYHFDLTRPGIGLYGARPFESAQPVVSLDLPVIQARELVAGETVGYGNSWIADHPTRVATVSGGYADGITRHLSNVGVFFHGDTPCPILGRVSMDLIGVDITHLGEVPPVLTLLGPHQGVDDIADTTGTIGYEILTQLGHRYARTYERGRT
ncbi:alanine racemase [Maritimibacter sp. UBA3975]|uniref:alanine racemase n=1 Tax=Maritimibacter sp. UBA3975 TaxID=1946833 RepID=UPI000C0AC41B|nr:alanine racemase [Maritimibacter sp. UBA3975]MAM61171.1 alanine racemase [Maritimibacter sp.]|tara:strand:+ start:3384 stop:4433 length:1050 start_codon:yes stop_codon:yes gene_type:complete